MSGPVTLHELYVQEQLAFVLEIPLKFVHETVLSLVRQTTRKLLHISLLHRLLEEKKITMNVGEMELCYSQAGPQSPDGN